ncbi:MAG TPA: hypothetical protein VGD80_29015, partial [Kofleriaceae bacterium]
KPRKKRGEPTTTRQQASRRVLLVRSQREAYSREMGLDPVHNARTHTGLVDLWARHLDVVRQRWMERRASKRALAKLRTVLPEAVSGRDRQQAIDMLDQLSRWLDEVRAPEWMRSPEDKWIVDAQHELDDDELAKILSPAGYRRDRGAALHAVRERRRRQRPPRRALRQRRERERDRVIAHGDTHWITARERYSHRAHPRKVTLASTGKLYEHGSANMRAWLAAGRPAAERDKLCVHGERSIVRAVRGVVDKLPEPVAWHLVQTTAIACVRPGLGLTGPLPPPPPRPTTAIDIPFTDPCLIGHECAHSWHRNPRLWSGLTMAQIEAVDEAVRKLDIGAAERDERADLHELAADQLSCQWGFPVDTRNQREQRRALAAEDCKP